VAGAAASSGDCRERRERVSIQLETFADTVQARHHSLASKPPRQPTAAPLGVHGVVFCDFGGYMIERFRDRRRLLDALMHQKLVNSDATLAEAFADALDLRELLPGQPLVAQGQTDDHVCLLLAGSVDIIVNGRPIAKRHSGEHVGEMALLHPDGRRIATVLAAEELVVGCISESAFTQLAHQRPEIWRRIAASLADRLSQRGQYVRQRNETPIMFIGSSREGAGVAQSIQSGLAYDNVIVRVWTDQVFGPSNYSIEDLLREVADADFGVLVLSAWSAIQN
jgi:CRP/FNR family transcriptional regulator, cyclic AMP receptor protein